MSGLGNRGKGKVGTDAVFRKTEKPENQNTKNEEEREPVKKSFVFSYDLSEALREHAFKTRRKEVDIVRDALALYLKNPPA